MFNAFKDRSKGSGLDTPPASALQPQLTGDLRFKEGSKGFRSRYTSCVGTRPSAKIGKLTACPPKEEVAASAVVSTAADRSRASWTMFKCSRDEIINFTTRAQG